jgi:glycosyltransferase involved in cell wall biosynthesis
MKSNNKFSILIPCKNEKRNIKIIYYKITKQLIKYNYKYDICFVDDGSSDGTWYEIKKIKKKSKNIKGIALSKNFGKENAIDAGLNYLSNYKFYIILDADLQHPLEKIPEMIKLYNSNNFEIINTHRVGNREGFIREFFSNFFYLILSKITDLQIITKTTDFMLISEKVRLKFVSIKENNKTFRILIKWLGYKSISIPIKIKLREHDKSKYSCYQLIRLAINIFTSFSIYPFKLIGYLGALLTICSTLMIFVLFINLFLKFIIFSNIFTIITYFIFLQGLLMLAISILGIYISKILQNVNARPNFIIHETLEKNEKGNK